MLHPPENMHGNRSTRTAYVVRHADLRAIDLAFARFIPELLDDFADLLDAGCPDRVSAGFEATARVNRDLSAECRFSISSELACLALFAEPEVFDRTDLGDEWNPCRLKEKV